jgi:HK97 family phage portal protein
MTDQIRSLDNPATSIDDAGRSLVYGFAPNDANIPLTERRAMQVTGVYACVRLIAETIASLPLEVYERLERGRRKAWDHPAYPLLHDAPNSLMTAIVFRETLLHHALLSGNAYAAIGRNAEGVPVELLLLPPGNVAVGVVDGRKIYQVQSDGETLVFEADSMLHVPGLGYDGLVGWPALHLLGNALGLSIAAERFGSKFFANDATAGVLLKTPNKLTDKAYDRLKADWGKRSGGGAHSPAILEDGLDVSRLSIPPEDAQFLETRRFQLLEVARFFRVPPHMVGDLERATFSNIEHQALEFVTYTLRRPMVAMEQELNRKMFVPEERRRFYIEHNVEGLLRGDIKARYDAYAIGRNWGWLSVNDIRERENMNPVENGDQYLQPLNMIDAGAPPTPAAAPMRGSPDTLDAVLRDAVNRCFAREIDAVASASRGDFPTAMTNFRRTHAATVTEAFTPLAQLSGVPVATLAGEYMRLRDGFDPEADRGHVIEQIKTLL